MWTLLHRLRQVFVTSSIPIPERRKLVLDVKRRLNGKKTQQRSTIMAPFPNYFVAFRVSNDEILENITALQEQMMDRPVTSFKNCKPTVFDSTLIDVSKLHFSLHVMHLKDDEDVQKATEVLRTVFDNVKSQFNTNPLQLPVIGLGTFENKVLFAKINGDDKIERVRDLAGSIKTAYENAGFPGDARAFQAHMTIAKMSKARNINKKKFPYIPPELWTDDAEMDFGVQKLEEIELLKMEADPTTKYYKSIARFQFD